MLLHVIRLHTGGRARLAELRPFVDDLVAADRGTAPPPPPTTTGDDDSAPSSDVDSDDEIDYGT